MLNLFRANICSVTPTLPQAHTNSNPPELNATYHLIPRDAPLSLRHKLFDIRNLRKYMLSLSLRHQVGQSLTAPPPIAIIYPIHRHHRSNVQSSSFPPAAIHTVIMIIPFTQALLQTLFTLLLQTPPYDFEIMLYTGTLFCPHRTPWTIDIYKFNRPGLGP